MVTYQLPTGVQLLDREGYKSEEEFNQMQEKILTASICEGYRMEKILNQKYEYYFTINVGADRLWEVFRALTEKLFPDQAYAIYGMKGEDPCLSGYIKASKIRSTLSKCEYEFVQDGFLECGIAARQAETFDEVYIKSFKYLQVWTSQQEKVQEVLDRFELPFVCNLATIDQFPVVSNALQPDEKRKVLHYSDVLQLIGEQLS